MSIATPVNTGKLNKKGKPVFDLQNPRVISGDIPDDSEGLDIGPETAKRYAEIIRSAKTVLWNGPMGIFEDKRFAEGTNAVAQAVVEATQKNGAKTHHRRRRQREGAEPGGPWRQSDFHEHGRRREPGISRRQSTARRRGFERQVTLSTNHG